MLFCYQWNEAGVDKFLWRTIIHYIAAWIIIKEDVDMITAVSGTINFHTDVTNGKDSILVDAPESKGGTGSGYTPFDLLCAAYASCLDISARVVLDKMRIEYSEVKVIAAIDQSDESKTSFCSTIEITGELDQASHDRVVELAMKNCPIKQIFDKPIEYTAM